MTSSRPGWTLSLVVLLASACGGGGDPLSPPPTGGIALSIAGLPAGTPASITVSGPGGYSQAVTASVNLDNLTPGSYQVSSSEVSIAGQSWMPVPAIQTVSVPASPSRVEALVHYGVHNGRLIVVVNGLPSGTAGAVSVTGPGGYAQSLTATDTLEPVPAGAYAITATSVSVGPVDYAASPASQEVQVPAQGSATGTIAYAVFVPGSVNLFIDGMQLTQAVQSYSDTVPLVANRDAYLRVFVRADQANAIAPDVRVRLYDGANPVPVQTWTIPAPGASTPTSVDEGALNSSWNSLVPGSLIQPNLRILADVDPSATYAEGSESDNAFPVSGTPRQLVVRVVNPVLIRFVPVVVAGMAGNVSAANASQFLVTMKKVFPLRAVTPEVRSAPYTSSAPALVSDNANNAWGTVLSELNALRTADGYSGYYYGVVHPGYGSGVAGIGYVPGRTAVGWDNLPSGDGIMAHEFGHNLSLSHAPCDVAGDPNFPYAQGAIGVYGLDLSSLMLKPPTARDLMGYCNGIQWISDYHYLKAFNYRNANPQALRTGTAGEGLLVWGRVVNGAVELEPAFPVTAPGSVGGRGRYAVEALDDGGRVVARHRFDGELVADQPGEQRHFAFVMPLSAATRARIARLRVTGALQGSERTSAMVRTRPAPTRPQVVRMGPRGLRLHWDGARYPMALVREASTGQILAFARGGDALVASTASELSVTFSDGVQGVTELVRAP